ncbi:MAG: DUF5667 domain-containing protein [Chloroflexota bacterium]
MSEKIQDIANECLDRVMAGGSIGTCLEAYPEYASQLEPVLETSRQLMQECNKIEADAAFRDRLRQDLQRSADRKVRIAELKSLVLFWGKKWALAMSAILLVVVMGVAVTAASRDAVPDEVFYPVKLVTEDVRLTLTFSDTDRAALHLRFAERRGSEMVGMAEEGKTDYVLMLTGSLMQELARLQALTGIAAGEERLSPSTLVPGTEDSAREGVALDELLAERRNESLAILREAVENAPEKLRPMLIEGIRTLEEQYDRTISLVADNAAA